MHPIDLTVSFDPTASVVLEDAITFECGATRAQASDPNLFVYEHHGPEFGQADPGALTAFFEDLIQGRPLPLKFVSRETRDVDTLAAVALFLHRDLAMAPSTVGFVAAVDLVHRRGLPFLSHVDSDLGLFLRLLRRYFPSGLSRSETGSRLETALGWIRDYLLNGRLPSMGQPFSQPTVLDLGTNGFVVAESTHDPLEGWVELYRMGYLRGVLFGPRVVVSRKSAYVPFDLEKAAFLLEDTEPGWKVEGNWLWGPEGGSRISRALLLDLFVRV